MPKLSIIVPVHNEAARLPSLLARCAELHASGGPEREWILVDDGSTDGSVDLLEAHARFHRARLIRLARRTGKGGAVRSGIVVACGDIIAIQDADMEYDPGDLDALVAPLLDGSADAVLGSRFLLGRPSQVPWFQFQANRILTRLSNWLSGLSLTDMETGYKLVRADLLKAMNLRSHGFGIEVELVAYLAKARARVSEVPIRYYPRSCAEGKKIRWTDGIAALVHLVRFNLLTPIGQAIEA